MNVAELKEIIKDLPDGMDVFVGERLTEFAYGLVNTARVKEINMSEEPDGEVLARMEVLILEED